MVQPDTPSSAAPPERPAPPTHTRGCRLLASTRLLFFHAFTSAAGRRLSSKETELRAPSFCTRVFSRPQHSKIKRVGKAVRIFHRSSRRSDTHWSCILVRRLICQFAQNPALPVQFPDAKRFGSCGGLRQARRNEGKKEHNDAANVAHNANGRSRKSTEQWSGYHWTSSRCHWISCCPPAKPRLHREFESHAACILWFEDV